MRTIQDKLLSVPDSGLLRRAANYRITNGSYYELIEQGTMVVSRQRGQAKAGRLSDRDFAALASFRRSLRIFLAFSAQAARKAGLTPQQHQAILAIRGLAPENGLTINELAEHLLLKPQTAVELADRLELAGLVRRNRDDIDRRRVFLTLTDKAKRILEKLSAAHLAQIRREAPRLVELLHHVAKRGNKVAGSGFLG